MKTKKPLSPAAQWMLDKSREAQSRLSVGSQKLLELQQAADERNFDWANYSLKLKQHLADQQRETDKAMRELLGDMLDNEPILKKPD